MIIVLAYHSVAPGSDYAYAVSPEDFRWQLQYLKQRCFQFITIQAFETILRSGTTPDGNYAVVTFDDGYRDNWQYAWPILQEMEIPATIFLISNLIGKTMNGMSMLSLAEIQSLQAAGGIDFGSHTQTHYFINSTDVSAVQKELAASKQDLTQWLGQEIRYFAYPKGKYAPANLSAVRNCYALAFATDGLIEKVSRIDPILVPRVTLSKYMSRNKFILSTKQWFWWLKKIKKYATR